MLCSQIPCPNLSLASTKITLLSFIGQSRYLFQAVAIQFIHSEFHVFQLCSLFMSDMNTVLLFIKLFYQHSFDLIFAHQHAAFSMHEGQTKQAKMKNFGIVVGTDTEKHSFLNVTVSRIHYAAERLWKCGVFI